MVQEQCSVLCTIIDSGKGFSLHKLFLYLWYNMPDVFRASLFVAELLKVISPCYVHEHLLQTVGPTPGLLSIRDLLAAGDGHVE